MKVQTGEQENSMTIRLNPYLGFRNNARAAIEYYHSVFGGDLTVSSFADMQASSDPAEDNLVMHSQLVTENGLTLMASDTPASMSYNPGDNFSVSLSGEADDEATLRGYWEKLSDGGTVTAPFDKAPWGDWFGMCVDRFGVNWLVDVAGTPAT
jgi:PhnB protein